MSLLFNFYQALIPFTFMQCDLIKSDFTQLVMIFMNNFLAVTD